MPDEYTLLHLAAELSLPEHIQVLLTFDVNVNIKSQVSVLGCCNISCKTRKMQTVFITLCTLNNSAIKPHFIMLHDMVTLKWWNI